MPNPLDAVNWMADIARDDSHGYSQNNRWGPEDYDCSSLVITAFRDHGWPGLQSDAGFSKTSGYTGTMRAMFERQGFVWIPWARVGGLTGLRPGDILLNIIRHTAAVLDDKFIVQASIDEAGKTIGAVKGDQTGREINISPKYVYWAGWDGVLRWPGDQQATAVDLDRATIAGMTSTALVVDGSLGPATATLIAQRLGCTPSGADIVTRWKHQLGDVVVDRWIGGQDTDRYIYSLSSQVLPGVAGSGLCRSIQHRLGLAQTGQFDRGTVQAIQEALNNGWDATSRL